MKCNKKVSVKPFLKWAGGKRWLVKNYSHFFCSKSKRYIEPFLGGGSVFFHLHPSTALLSDKNEELINTYIAIRDEWEKVLVKLRQHQKEHSDDYYYQIRKSQPRSTSGKAARFIYLNRTCWNGLYRVNMKGKFNVPRGTKDSVLLPDDCFDQISNLLSKCEIVSEDFESILTEAGKGDFVFIDPPYTVKHNNNNFIKYNETIFSWADQQRLARAAHLANYRGATIVISNADHECIRELYKDFGSMTSISRNSVLAADSEKRRKTTELLITNLKND